MDYKYLFEYKDGNLYWKNKTYPTARIKIGDKAGSLRSDGYIKVQINRKKYAVHRIIYEMFHGAIPNGMEIDHINNNPSDNRIENLQCITHTQNTQRADKGLGISYRKCNGKYQSRKKFNKKEYHLGFYGTPCGAYMANRMFFMRGI